MGPRNLPPSAPAETARVRGPREKAKTSAGANGEQKTREPRLADVAKRAAGGKGGANRRREHLGLRRIGMRLPERRAAVCGCTGPGLRAAERTHCFIREDGASSGTTPARRDARAAV